MAQEDPGLVAYVVGAIAAGAAAVIAWIGKNTMGRITALEQSKVDKTDFKEYAARADKSRDELRDSQKLIFAKVDGLRDHVDEKFDRLADLIRERR